MSKLKLFVPLFFLFYLMGINSVFALEKIKAAVRSSVTGKIIAEYNVEVAINFQDQAKGLSHRQYLADNEGMIFVFPPKTRISFWMKDTYIPLDLIFINADGKINDIVSDAKPLSETPLYADYPYQYCLEINAGQAKQKGIVRGDWVIFPKISTTAQ